ncbi:MAG: DEAD/DEAH box helicase [Nitratireductor sp.]
MTNFTGVAPALAQALENRGYTKLTQVQSAVIEPDLLDKDLLVSAQTGSGKTVAFGLNIASQLLSENGKLPKAGAPLALIVAPTRELALQVQREIQWLYEKAGAYTATCVGGMDMRMERKNLLKGAHIVVGTPGRLNDHINRRSLDMNDLKVVVLDEADEMLDLGFREELETILEAAPQDRRTLMFSATVPKTIANMAKRYQTDAVRLTTEAETSQHDDIEYRALMVAHSDRENAIINTIRYYEPKNTIIFCGTRATVNHMTARFNNRGFRVVALSGELSQAERNNALQSMRDGRAQVCIATDVAARGIDLPGLELVIHADIPKTAETLKHRSGRTGRAGNKGTCTIIVPNNARNRTERLLRLAKIDAQWAKPPSANEVLERDNARMLEDAVFNEDVKKSERALIEQLLEMHSPEKIAAALLRRFKAERSAPEELSDTPEYVPGNYSEKRGKGKSRDRYSKRPFNKDDNNRGPRGNSRGGSRGAGRGEFKGGFKDSERDSNEGSSDRFEGRRNKSSGRKDFKGDRNRDGASQGHFDAYADIPPKSHSENDSLDSVLAHAGPAGAKGKKPHKKKLAKAAARADASKKISKRKKKKNKS